MTEDPALLAQLHAAAAEGLERLPSELRPLTRRRDGAAGDLLARYTAHVLRVNRVLNLTADDEPGRFWRRHIVDCLAAAWLLERATDAPASGSWADIGSGAGLPGFVWAIVWPSAHLTLIEATGKKARTLEAIRAALDLANVAIAHGRAEDLAHDAERRERFDGVVARAVAPLATLAELTLPFVRVGGRFAAPKSPGLDPADPHAEYRAAARAIDRLGGRVQDPPWHFEYVRGDGAPAGVYLIDKVAPTPPQYPRAPGRPAKRPLG